MVSRRDFLNTLVGAGCGAALQGPAVGSSQQQGKVVVGDRSIRVVDIHAHCVIPEVASVVRGTSLAAHMQDQPRASDTLGPDRLQQMDNRGIHVQVLSINGFWWYQADHHLAREIIRVQDEGLAEWCSRHSDRFVALTSPTLQHPELASEQLEYAIKRLGMRGACIGGHVDGEPISSPKFAPFLATAERLDAVIFMHPSGAENLVKEGALRGRGGLGNIIGNPLETTLFLSQLIFEGTLDKYPRLRICAAHAGGYLPSYLGRSEVACAVRANANCANTKRPSEYLKSQIMVDSLIFSDEGLRHLVAEMGASQVVYGTDMPFNWPDSLDIINEAAYLTSSEKEAILGGTLAKVLRL